MQCNNSLIGFLCCWPSLLRFARLGNGAFSSQARKLGLEPRAKGAAELAHEFEELNEKQGGLEHEELDPDWDYVQPLGTEPRGQLLEVACTS